jgi:bifunctional aspartokinase / homoserine dehydrogenase 1
MNGAVPSTWVVHKFGGSSVASAECFERVAEIVESQDSSKLAVVLSACKGVTDALLQLVWLAEHQDEGWRVQLHSVRERHFHIGSALLPAAALSTYMAEYDHDCVDLESVLRTTQVMRTASQHVRDKVSGYGELWSTRLFCHYLEHRGRRRGVQWIDARACVLAEWSPLGASIHWQASDQRLRALLRDEASTLVITGYIASDPAGIQTTLGRNGSDFSASIFGSLLNASEIQIWTDVDGVLSADPRRVPDAQVIPALSYNEAMELAYFGAKVIHPQTMAPAIGRAIPIRIRNTFAPSKPGTLISAQPRPEQPVKGITSIEHVALVNLEGAGMIGVPGTAHRLFGALREEDISVILISQASSEHSICCAVPAAQAARATAAVERAFARELAQGQVQSIEVTGELAILAVVGDGMAGTPGVASKVFAALGAANVNVRAIAQGASERNISAVVEARQATRALRAVHAGFYLSPHTLSIGVIGPGQVGKVLLDQLAGQRARLAEQFNIDLRVRGIMSSKTMTLADPSIALERWREQLGEGAMAADYEQFYEHLKAAHVPHTAIIDCSASQEVANRYHDWLAAGVHLITPNKKANSGPLPYYRSLERARRGSGAHYLYHATVGAGLPVIHTLRDLRETGDEIISIEGIFSGTLAYLFNVYDGSVPFSAIVRDARERGYTEPDPRDDLSGSDVARKLTILGREMGLALELSDVRVESLVPHELVTVTLPEFMAQLPRYDADMGDRCKRAGARGCVLRYVGRLTAAGEATVRLEELDNHHAFANIALTDNIVRYVTSRYCDNPLIIQGPGAGPAVTAGGVFADLLRAATFLGAHL